MKRDLIKDKIKDKSIKSKFPDGKEYLKLSVKSVAALSNELNLCAKEIEINALKLEILPERYNRNMKTFSYKDQVTLLKSKVTVVGLGGLGGNVSEILARCGIGTLTLIDGDIFDDSNLNRQLFSTTSLLGKSKAEAAKARISDVNPCVDLEIYDEYFNEKNGENLIKGSDLVIDCLDNLKTRFLLEKECKKAGCPLICAAVAGNAGHVTTVFPEDAGLSLIYGEPSQVREKGIETSLGCQPHAVSVIASLECSEAVKILLKKENLLRNRLLLIDLGDYSFETLKLI